MTQVFINGKFAARPLSGVERVAEELVKALDRCASRRESGLAFSLLLPAGASVTPLSTIATAHVAGSMPLTLWEQGPLARAARGGLLLNLAGSAPWLADSSVTLLHDAAPFDRPQHYSLAFAAWHRAGFRIAARRSPLLLTVSEFSRGRLAHHLGVDPQRIGVVPNGADHLQGREVDDSVLLGTELESLPFLLAVGSGNPGKNHHGLVQAWKLLGRKNARLVLVGRTRPRVFAMDRFPAAPGVISLGAVSDGQLKALYRKARGLFLPSFYEGFGLPVLEAMDQGCPVAASNQASLPEVCGAAALAFDPWSSDEMAHAMRVLLDDEPERMRLRQLGLERASQFRWDQSARLLIDFLERMG